MSVKKPGGDGEGESWEENGEWEHYTNDASRCLIGSGFAAYGKSLLSEQH